MQKCFLKKLLNFGEILAMKISRKYMIFAILKYYFGYIYVAKKWLIET